MLTLVLLVFFIFALATRLEDVVDRPSCFMRYFCCCFIPSPENRRVSLDDLLENLRKKNLREKSSGTAVSEQNAPVSSASTSGTDTTIAPIIVTSYPTPTSTVVSLLDLTHDLTPGATPDQTPSATPTMSYVFALKEVKS